MNCGSCGNPVEQGTQFCGSCGAQIAWQQPIQQQVATTQVVPQATPSLEPVVPNTLPTMDAQAMPTQPVAAQPVATPQPQPVQPVAPMQPQQPGVAPVQGMSQSVIDTRTIKGKKAAAVTGVILGVIAILIGLAVLSSEEFSEQAGGYGGVYLVLGAVYLGIGTTLLAAKSLPVIKQLLYVGAGVSLVIVLMNLLSGSVSGILYILFIAFAAQAISNIRKAESGKL